jgi:hypothetical protein
MKTKSASYSRQVLNAAPAPGTAKVCLAEKANECRSLSAATCTIGIEKRRAYNTKNDVRVYILFIMILK